MKTMAKLGRNTLAMLLVVCMMFSISAVAFADGEPVAEAQPAPVAAAPVAAPAAPAAPEAPTGATATYFPMFSI